MFPTECFCHSVQIQVAEVGVECTHLPLARAEQGWASSMAGMASLEANDDR